MLGAGRTQPIPAASGRAPRIGATADRFTTSRTAGTVTWFDVGRGSGFIDRDGGETDCFVRHSALRGSILGLLTQGDRVEFDLIEGNQGPRARNVVRIGQ